MDKEFIDIFNKTNFEKDDQSNFGDFHILEKYLCDRKNVASYMKKWHVSYELSRILMDKKLENKKKINAVYNYFSSIPIDYRVVFSFKNICLENELEIELSDIADLKFKNLDFVPQTLLGSLFFKAKMELHIKHHGYLNDMDYDSVHRKFKRFICIAISMNLIKFDETSIYSTPNTRHDSILEKHFSQNYKKNYYSDSIDNKKVNILIDNDEQLFLDNLSIFVKNLQNDEISNKFKKTWDYVLSLDSKATDPLKKDKKNTWVEKIQTSLDWMYLAEITKNQTFKYILYNIALEAVAGTDDRDQKVLNTLINRCSYLIGDTHKRRDDVMEKLKEIYKLRSILVHGNRSSLNDKESDKLDNVREIAEEVIRRELEILNNG